MHIPEDEAERRRLNERGREILRRKNGAVRPHREDGYVNLLNKYGTKQDDLEWEERAATAIKWTRLYGGALIVMLIDDGRGLEEPVDWEHIRSIDELRVYERSIVQPDYASLYQQDYGGKGVGNRVSKFGQPEYYYVSSIYGSFKVHESRCLVFRNGVLPEQTSNATYLFWGMPEYVRIRRALRETVTAHTDSVKLLERSVQAIYSMKGLASLLTTDDGENQVLKRLQLVDTSRGLLNSIAIDSEGEQYDFKTFQFSGVKDVIDATCNMLSALTNIPQTILFGRSPAGMNATGDSDFESYYNFVEKIQRLMLKRNLRTLLDVVFRAGIASGDVAEEPDYKLEFKPLWSLSDTEQAAVDQTKAQTALVKAQTAQAYVDMQALDPTEVRRRLASDEEFDVEDIISEDDEDDLLQSLLGTEPSTMSDVEAAQKNIEQGQAPGGEEQSATVAPTATPPTTNADAADADYGVGVLVVQDGRFLCGTRLKGGSVGGPGGHIEAGESPEDAAIRETREEFGITPKDLMPVAFLSDLKPPYCPSHVFICTDFDGSIRCADGEMTSPGFITAEKVAELSTQNPERLFPPFAQSITALLDALSSNPGLTSDAQNAKMKDRMDFNEADHPRDENGQFAEGEGSSSGSTESGPAVSPEGENVPCTGFASPARLEDHATRHGLAEMGFATKEEYQQKGIDFLKQPCGGDVIGYARPDGVVVRFNTKTTEYATGVPGGPLKTYMKAKCNRKTGEARPEVAMKYYEFNREKDLKEVDDEQGS